MPDRKVTVRLEVVVDGERSDCCGKDCMYSVNDVTTCFLFNKRRDLTVRPGTREMPAYLWLRTPACLSAESRETKGAKGDG